MYKNCKFGTYCKFEHDLPKDENNEEIENIKKELEELKERIIEKEKEIKHKDDEAADLMKNFEMKLKDHEQGEMLMNEKIVKISNNFQAKVNDLEKSIEIGNKVNKNLYEKIENLEKINKSILKDLEEIKEENIRMNNSVNKMEREEPVDGNKYKNVNSLVKMRLG